MRFVTGHTQGSDGLALNWENLADPETTLVIYMGVTNVTQITERLTSAGLPAETPAAVINRGTREDQNVITTTLSRLSADIAAEDLSGPTLMVIGRVVKLADQLAWFEAALERQPRQPITKKELRCPAPQ